MYARIFYNPLNSNPALVDRVEGSATETGQPHEAMHDRLTWSQTRFIHRADGVYYSDLVFTNQQTINCVALQGHNFPGTTARLLVAPLETDPFTLITPIVTGRFGQPVLQQFPAVTVQKIRLEIIYSSAPSLSVLAVGQALDLPEPIPLGVLPHYGRDTELFPNVSERGELLGTAVVRTGWQFDIVQNAVDPGWVQTHWPLLIREIEALPFFYQWDRDNPLAVAYAWVNKKPGAPRYTTQTLMNFKIPCRGVYVS